MMTNQRADLRYEGRLSARCECADAATCGTERDDKTHALFESHTELIQEMRKTLQTELRVNYLSPVMLLLLYQGWS